VEALQILGDPLHSARKYDSSLRHIDTGPDKLEPSNPLVFYNLAWQLFAKPVNSAWRPALDRAISLATAISNGSLATGPASLRKHQITHSSKIKSNR